MSKPYDLVAAQKLVETFRVNKPQIVQWREEVLSRAEHQNVARLTYDLKVAKENFSQQRHNRIEFETRDNFYKNIVSLVKTELLSKRGKTDSLAQETTHDQKAETELEQVNAEKKQYLKTMKETITQLEGEILYMAAPFSDEYDALSTNIAEITQLINDITQMERELDKLDEDGRTKKKYTPAEATRIIDEQIEKIQEIYEEILRGQSDISELHIEYDKLQQEETSLTSELEAAEKLVAEAKRIMKNNDITIERQCQRMKEYTEFYCSAIGFPVPEMHS
ncbi:4970_t:CDS:2 [Paraglomus brasilianum]|uniref:4970_t:CDS:1 n=1 Tax=Paraglomus brasilianum TaxID=144538 RepID=A0A9N9G4C5_9GLOM|nr:4970_t:CDS:2 [Paraglomus brasilianum]